MSRAKSASAAQRIELGRYIVADPAICHGKPTFKGTRVFVADVLADVERGLSWDFIVQRWGGGKISKAAITEAVRLIGQDVAQLSIGDDNILALLHRLKQPTLFTRDEHFFKRR